MKTVEIVPGIRTSSLGFGCAPILGSVDAQTARKAIHAALDQGITHFDLARSYGYGMAESFVGNILRDRREQVTIATKFGIEATAAAVAIAPLKPFIRAIRKRRSSPADQETTESGKTQTAGHLPKFFLKRKPITSARLEKSLTKSLREMKTDYVDFLFIHEPLDAITDIDSVMESAERFVAAGKIRAFGLASSCSLLHRHDNYLTKPSVLQCDCPDTHESRQELKSLRQFLPTIFFSPFKNREGSSSPQNYLVGLLQDFEKSIILATMMKIEHIRANARACS